MALSWLSRRCVLLSLALCHGLAWAASPASAPLVQAAASAQTPAAAVDFYMEALERAIEETPYTALIVHTRVDIHPLPHTTRSPAAWDAATNERQVYYARVFQTFRGKRMAHIRYELVAERGEGAHIDSKPQIITLCSGPRGFYWPGTGANFPVTDASLALARKVGRQVAAAPTRRFAQCD
jgi:hypothetical protein